MNYSILNIHPMMINHNFRMVQLKDQEAQTSTRLIKWMDQICNGNQLQYNVKLILHSKCQNMIKMKQNWATNREIISEDKQMKNTRLLLHHLIPSTKILNLDHMIQNLRLQMVMIKDMKGKILNSNIFRCPTTIIEFK